MKIILLMVGFIFLFANQNVTIQLNWKYQFEFAGFIMAKEKGFYKKEGLNVNLKELTKNLNVIKYVLNHKNSYGVGDGSLIGDIMEKTPIELLIPIYENSPFVLTAVNLKNITSLKDIVKNNIVLGQFAIKNPSILAMLKSKNIDISKLHIKKENFYNNIHKKGVFAFYESNEIYSLKKNHIPYKIFDPKKYGFDFYGDILFTSKNEVKNNPKKIREIIKATKEGYIYAFNHINETINVILKKYNTQHFTYNKLLYEAKFLKKLLSNNFEFNLNKILNIKNVFIILGWKNDNIKHCIYNPFSLTYKELKFIKNHTIRAVSTSTWEPFNLIHNGKLDGIAIDYWNYIKTKVGLKTEYILNNNWSEVLNKIKNKQADITLSTTITPDRKKYAIFSKPYVSFPLVIATRNNVGFISNIIFLKDKIIAVGKNYTAEKLLKAKYPNLKLLEVKSTDEALKLVSKGKAYAAIDILPVIAYKITKYQYANLKIAGKTNIIFNVRFMVRNDYPELISIINKVIKNMPQSEKNKIYKKWVSVHYQNGYSSAYLNKIYLSIGIVLVIILSLIFYLILNISKRQKLEEKLEELATIDKLTSIFNRYKIDMALNEQIEISKRYHRPLSFIFFDIDHFKSVNDTYGHKTGDYVLIELSKITTENTRASDIFGRWGGEEFLIILPETNLEQAFSLGEKLRKIIEGHNFKKVSKITCSFGVTQFKVGDTTETAIERIDSLLYKSKETGRNKVTKG